MDWRQCRCRGDHACTIQYAIDADTGTFRKAAIAIPDEAHVIEEPEKYQNASHSKFINPIPTSPRGSNDTPRSPSDLSGKEVVLLSTPRSERRSRQISGIVPTSLCVKSVHFNPKISLSSAHRKNTYTIPVVALAELRIAPSVSILRVKSNPNILHERVSKPSYYHNEMVNGTTFKLHQGNGRSSLRRVRISTDGTELLHSKMRMASIRLENKLVLASVERIVYGPRTHAFASYDWKTGSPWLCFSLITDNYTIDVECTSIEELSIWFLGLQRLVPLSHAQLSKARLIWYRALFKTIQIALLNEMPTVSVWDHFVYQARLQEFLRRARLVRFSPEDLSSAQISDHHKSISDRRLLKITGLLID